MNNKTLRCYALTLDPLHIGAGGHHLSRVDKAIIREPGSGLPKLPASSIAGACRNHALYALPDEEQKKARDCASKKDERDAAVKDRGNCGDCVICQTFGFVSPDKGKQVGRVKFFDGRLVAFPTRSMAGPVWVTTASLLREAGGAASQEPGDNTLLVNFALPGNPEEAKKLNLGWLYCDAAKDEHLALPEISGLPPELGQRLVLAPEWLFAEIVNNNLEVRASAGVDFATGAARPGTAFSYEAIPRTALFVFDVVIDSRHCATDDEAAKAREIVTKGFDLFPTLGMGGMSSRGFGRVKIVITDLPSFEEEPSIEEESSIKEESSLEEEPSLEEKSGTEEESSFQEKSP